MECNLGGLDVDTLIGLHVYVFTEKHLTQLTVSLWIQVIHEMLAQLARRRLDAISTDVYEAQFKLKALPPSTTLELGTYLTSLDDIKDTVKLVSLGYFYFLSPFIPLGSHREGVGACPSCMGEGRVPPAHPM